MIKAEIKDTTSVDVKPFPKLMKFRLESSNMTYLVLFKTDRCGTVVYSKNAILKTADYSENWDMSGFTDFDGEITLKNE